MLPHVYKVINEGNEVSDENPAEAILEEQLTGSGVHHTTLLSKDGTSRQIAEKGSPIRNRDNQIVGVVLVFRDITREIELQENQKYISLLLIFQVFSVN